MIFAVAIILFFLALSGKLAIDIRKYHSRKSVNHTKEAAMVILCLVPSVIIFLLQSELPWYWALVVILLMLFFNFWNLFDGLYNKFRGYGWWFNGSVDPDDSKLDRMLMRISVAGQAVIKIGGSLTFIWLYIKYLK